MDSVEDCLGVVFDFYFVLDVGDLFVGIDQECGVFDIYIFLVIEFFEYLDVIGFQYSVIFV